MCVWKWRYAIHHSLYMLPIWCKTSTNMCNLTAWNTVKKFTLKFCTLRIYTVHPLTPCTVLPKTCWFACWSRPPQIPLYGSCDALSFLSYRSTVADGGKPLDDCASCPLKKKTEHKRNSFFCTYMVQSDTFFPHTCSETTVSSVRNQTKYKCRGGHRERKEVAVRGKKTVFSSVANTH